MHPNRVVLLVALVFAPAALGLGAGVLGSIAPDHRYLALALLLLCLDQTRMAIADLQDIAAITAQSSGPDLRLDRFRLVTWSTMTLELIGFYGAGFWGAEQALGWGGILVLLSQLWFHGLAGVQLRPAEAEPVVELGIGGRSPVLMADAVGLGLTVLWVLQVAPLVMALALLSMLIAYGFVKYGHLGQSKAGH